MVDLILGDRVLDAGLAALDSEATHIYVCSAQPTTYAEASSAFALGNKNFGAGAVFASPTAGSPGRSVTSAAVSGGAITANGTVAYWAVTDNAASRLLATGALTGGAAVTAGQSFTLDSFIIQISGEVASGVVPGPEAADFLARLVTDPGQPRKDLYAELINGLVADGAWEPIDILKIYAADTQANACVNLRTDVLPGGGPHPGLSTIVGTVAFVADRGFTSGGAGTDVVDEHYVPATNKVALTTTSVSLGVWCLTNHANAAALSGDQGSIYLNINPNYSGSAYFRIMEETPAGSAGSSDGIGFFLGTRSNSTTSKAYKNKVLLSTITSTAASTLPAGTLTACCENGTGQIAAALIGGDLDAVQDKIYDRLHTYLQAVGAV